MLQSLEKAKEAGRKERVLVRQREQLGTSEQINLDLTYSVSCFSFTKQEKPEMEHRPHPCVIGSITVGVVWCSIASFS